MAATSSGISNSVIFELQSTYVSSVETFPLTISQVTCFSATKTVTIRPASGATGLSITSANATGTINFDGGDYVIFDGRPGGTGTTSQLSISNTVTTGYAIQFINNATFNSIKYCSYMTGLMHHLLHQELQLILLLVLLTGLSMPTAFIKLHLVLLR